MLSPMWNLKKGYMHLFAEQQTETYEKLTVTKGHRLGVEGEMGSGMEMEML